MNLLKARPLLLLWAPLLILVTCHSLPFRQQRTQLRHSVQPEQTPAQDRSLVELYVIKKVAQVVVLGAVAFLVAAPLFHTKLTYSHAAPTTRVPYYPPPQKPYYKPTMKPYYKEESAEDSTEASAGPSAEDCEQTQECDCNDEETTTKGSKRSYRKSRKHKR